MLETLRKSYRLASETRRSRWVVLMVLAIIVSVVEAIGAIMIFSLLALISSSDAHNDVPVPALLHRLMPSLDERALTIASIITIAAFFVGRAVIATLQSYLQSRVTQNAGVLLSARLLRGYLSLPYALHLQRSSSELMRNVFTGVTELTAYAWTPAVGMASDGLTVTAIATVLMVTAPIPTLATIGVLGPAIFILLKIVQPRLRRLGALTQTASGSTFRSLQETIDGLRDIKLLGREKHFADVFTASRSTYARAQYGRAVLTEFPRIALETTLMLFILGFLLVTTIRDSGGAARSDALAVLGLFGYAVIRLLPSINRTVANVNSLRYGAAAVDNVFADVELIDSHLRLDRDEPVAPMTFTRSIEFEDVSFTYPEADATALEQVSLIITKGTSVGFVGSTGAGKTTLLDLLVGLVEPSRGRILVDGRDIAQSTRSWQLNLGIVPQTLFLTDDTLRRNIALGESDEDINDDAVRNAIATAQLRDFVDDLPLGLDTIVGERGVRLSGGQRQRIAIARAIYRDPPVLVLDEGTSALDMSTEAKVVAALDSIRRDRTIVIVAHRLATVRACDRIVVLDGGSVIDEGSYDELHERSPSFRALAGEAHDGAA